MKAVVYLGSGPEKGLCLQDVEKPVPGDGEVKLLLLSAKANVRDLDNLASLVAKGRLKPVVQNIYPLERAAEAFCELSKGHGMGKTVIAVSE